MSVPVILGALLLILMVVIGDEKGIKSFFTLIINFAIFFIMLSMIVNQKAPLKTTVIACTAISAFTLFYINGLNRKTISALLSVLGVVLLTLLITYKIAGKIKIQGFSTEQTESIEYLSLYVNLDFTKIIVCEILIGLISAITDTSITIASSMNEIRLNNPDISKKSLFASGMNIGREILGTTVNTLLFAYLGGFMALLIWFSKNNYSRVEIFNSKVFCAEAFQILCSGIGVILIIPITAYVSMHLLGKAAPHPLPE